MNWKLRTCVLPLCTAALTMLVAETDANAVIINETENFDITGTDAAPGAPSNGTTTLQFDLFNGALGTLNNVTVTIDSLVDTNLAIQGAEGGSGNSGHDGTVDSATLGATNVNIDFDTVNVVCTQDICSENNGTVGIPVIGDLFGILGLGGPTVANFIGPGTFDIDLAAIADITFCSSGGLAQPTCDATTNWTGSITVAYDFSTFQGPGEGVPEPATLGLFGFGVAGLGYMARRRRKSSASA